MGPHAVTGIAPQAGTGIAPRLGPGMGPHAVTGIGPRLGPGLRPGWDRDCPPAGTGNGPPCCDRDVAPRRGVYPFLLSSEWTGCWSGRSGWSLRPCAVRRSETTRRSGDDHRAPDPRPASHRRRAPGCQGEQHHREEPVAETQPVHRQLPALTAQRSARALRGAAVDERRFCVRSRWASRAARRRDSLLLVQEPPPLVIATWYYPRSSPGTRGRVARRTRVTETWGSMLPASNPKPAFSSRTLEAFSVPPTTRLKSHQRC